MRGRSGSGDRHHAAAVDVRTCGSRKQQARGVRFLLPVGAVGLRLLHVIPDEGAFGRVAFLNRHGAPAVERADVRQPRDQQQPSLVLRRLAALP